MTYTDIEGGTVYMGISELASNADNLMAEFDTLLDVDKPEEATNEFPPALG